VLLRPAREGGGVARAWRQLNRDGDKGDAMKVRWISGVLLGCVAALALGAGSASASIPEAGYCRHVAEGSHGAYIGANCIARSTNGKGLYEWTPITEAEKVKFSGAGGEVKLWVGGRVRVKCIVANLLNGEFTGPKSIKASFELQACDNIEGQQCTGLNTPNSKSEIETVPLEGELGMIKNIEGAPKTVGIDFKPQAPLTDWAVYECNGNPLQTFRLEGSMIARVAPVSKMTTVQKLFILAPKGIQTPESFEGGPTDTLSETIMTGTSSETLPAALNVKGYEGSYATELEIKASEK
jgi:hypothetical protein